jgi:hypothetical protein
MYLNQFAQTPIKGNSATKVNLNTLPVTIDPNSTATLLPGDAVYLTTSTANQIYVDQWSAGKGIPFGYILYNMRIDQFVKNDRVEIGLSGTIMFGEAGATISRGQNLEYQSNAIATGPLMIPAAGINPISGIALDNASSGGIFRFMVLWIPEVTASVTTNYTSLTTGNNSINPYTQGETIFVSATLAQLTFNASAVIPGKTLRFIITNASSATTVVSFGTNFRASGTLPTSSTLGKIATIMFIADGITYDEIARISATTGVIVANPYSNPTNFGL